LGYDFTLLTGSSGSINSLNQATVTSSQFRQQQVGLTVHLAL
jgi:hypothetical protein